MFIEKMSDNEFESNVETEAEIHTVNAALIQQAVYKLNKQFAFVPAEGKNLIVETDYHDPERNLITSREMSFTVFQERLRYFF